MFSCVSPGKSPPLPEILGLEAPVKTTNNTFDRNLPKGPRRTKMLRRSKFARRRKTGWMFDCVVSDIFHIFFCWGEGKGESEALGGGGERFFIENPRRGGGVSRAGRGGGEGPGGCLRGIRGGGGGLKIFFRGRNPHQEN